MSLFKKIHQFLLPSSLKLGYQPYLWLGYLLLYFFNYLFRKPDAQEIIVSTVGILIFLVLYFSAYRRKSFGIGLHVAGIYLIGAVLAFWNLSSTVFFVYAACVCAFMSSPKHGVIGIVIIDCLIGLQSWLFDFPSYFYLPGIFFSTIIGISNVYFAQLARKNRLIKASQEEIKHLAITAERERIARDLHDLIGHTFSLLTKKAELAQKLLDKHPEKVMQELVDIENTSRDALSQVRAAVSGYRSLDFHSELITARGLCRAAEIRYSETIKVDELPKAIDQAFAFIVREAFTNVVRHSNATECHVELSNSEQTLKLTVQDNGSVGEFVNGNGLTGMQERLNQLGGQLSTEANQGFHLLAEVRVP